MLFYAFSKWHNHWKPLRKVHESHVWFIPLASCNKATLSPNVNASSCSLLNKRFLSKIGCTWNTNWERYFKRLSDIPMMLLVSVYCFCLWKYNILTINVAEKGRVNLAGVIERQCRIQIIQRRIVKRQAVHLCWCVFRRFQCKIKRCWRGVGGKISQPRILVRFSGSYIGQRVPKRGGG